MVAMTLVTIPLMDRVGRRTLHLVGLAGIILCSIMITIALNYSTASTKKTDTGINFMAATAIANTSEARNVADNVNNESQASGVGIFLVISTLSFVVFFALGPGSIPWMAAGEMFSQGARAPAISLCVFTNWLANLVVSLVFPQLQLHLENFSFLPFLLITAILFSILFFYLTETKGQTSNEVAQIYQTPRAWTTFIGSQRSIQENLRSSENSRIELSKI
jgi:SP family facilitated glucose transporter-like MFS transporter 1